MLKKLLVILAMLYAAVAFAAVDVNKATATELDAIKGIGPVMSKRILDERKKGEFKNWDDLMGRVKGIAPISAAKFSAAGLTVNGADFKNPSLSKNAAKEEKKEAKADAKADKKDAKADKKEDKKEAKSEKKEEKAVAKAEKKDDKKDDKPAAAAKPAASAKK